MACPVHLYTNWMRLHSHSTNGLDVARGRTLRATANAALAAMVRPAESLCMRRGIRPDTLTWGSLGLAALSAAACARGSFSWGGVLYLGAGVLDLLDGRVARASGTASARGAALDSIVDRVAEALVLGGLAWGAHSRAAASLCFAFLTASTIVSYARARGEGLGVSVRAGLMVRAPRLALLGVVMITEGFIGSGASGPSWFLLVSLTVLVVLTFGTAARRFCTLLRSLPGPGAKGARDTLAPSPSHPSHVRPTA